MGENEGICISITWERKQINARPARGIWGKEELSPQNKGEKQKIISIPMKTYFIRGSRFIFDPGSQEKQYPGL